MALVGALAFGATRLVDVHPAATAIAGALKPSAVLVPASSEVLLPGLEPGACISQPPTRDARGQTVFIDPGHGGLDPGVVGGTTAHPVLEKDATLAVGMLLSAQLRADGYRVVMARSRDSTVLKMAAGDSVMGSLTADFEHRDLVARAACANASGAAALLSIHFDAFADPAVGGTETFYDSARTFAAANRRLATDVQAALVSALGTSDRGIWTDDQLAAPTLTQSGSSYGHLIELGPPAAGWVDAPSRMPGALVEPLFITNAAEAKIASGVAGQQQIASALEAGLLRFLSGS